MRAYLSELDTVVGGRFVSIPDLPAMPTVDGSEYVIDERPDTMDVDLIAYALFGDSSEFWRIAALNYGQFQDAFDPPEGVPVLLPSPE